MPSRLTTDSVHFNFPVRTYLRERTRLKLFIAGLFKREKKQLCDIQYIFCSDGYLLNINRKWLDHNYYTDIISFDLSAPNQPITAEIYISIDRVKENAREFGTPISRELHRVIFHGALHLCGYKDKSRKEKMEMRQMEETYLTLYFAD
jgi:probable rRNA maturation factor